jgi:hypothetical protein
MESLKRFADGCGTETDRRNQRRVVVWSLLWVSSWLAVHFAVSRGWVASELWALVANAVPAVLGLAVIAAYRRFLTEADELRRKIELDALAVAFGVGVVGGLVYWLLGRTGLVPEPDVLILVTAMIFAQGVGVLLGQRRYA